MNPILTAANAGYTAIQILSYLKSNFPELRKKISQAEKKGHSADQIVSFLSGQKSGQEPFFKSYTPPKTGMTQAEFTAQGPQRQEGSSLGQIGKLAAGAAGLYGAYKALQPMTGMAANILSGGPPIPQGPTAPITPQTGLSPPLAPQVAPISTQTPIPTPKPSFGKFISSLVAPVAQIFGFKNKNLVGAVAKIVEQTGEEVKDVYDRLSKEYDISTVEKATKAAQDSLARSSGEGKTEKARELVQKREEAEKRLSTAKPIAEAKKDLAKSLKSSTIRKMNYDPDNKEMDIVFNSGDIYRYYDFDQSSWDKLSAKGTPAKTSGSNKFGVWWTGKNPSAGATFNQIIQPSKRGNGPFRYEKVGVEAMTPEEEKEYEEVQRPLSKQAVKFLSASEKAEKAQKGIPSIAKGLTGEQIRNRVNTLNKQLESAKSKSGEARNEQIIQSIKDRLETMHEMDILRRSRKSKMINEEISRFDKHTGEAFVKKVVTLLPKAVAKVVKSKIETTNEKDLLNTILEFLSAKK